MAVTADCRRADEPIFSVVGVGIRPIRGKVAIRIIAERFWSNSSVLIERVGGIGGRGAGRDLGAVAERIVG